MSIEMQAIIQMLIALWMIPIGFAWIVRGPRGALAVNRWAFRIIVRTIRRSIGGILIALGEFVRGKSGKRK